jgi:acyl transferase domain-containing protein
MHVPVDRPPTRSRNPQADDDAILAVIRGSADNQYCLSCGITYPNGFEQEEIIRQAMDNARVEPSQDAYY